MLDRVSVGPLSAVRRMLRLLGVVVALAALGTAQAPAAQTWPDRPIKIVVAAPAGSSLDVLARVIGDNLKDRLGQPVIVE
jgi:tripartite-type tricarboxylate transporter receptor subunit TctC